MVDKSTSRELNARVAVESIRGPMTNAQIMEQFRITPEGFADLLKQLYQKKLISDDDLSRRGIKFKVLKPPSAPAQASISPPPPVEHDEEFLDTVTLTELLSFKPQGPPAEDKTAEIPTPEEPTAGSQGSQDKKNKFSLTGLFKKAK
jgi:hypothetical protein